LDLSAAPPGDYVLSTEHDGDGGAYYYSLRLHQRNVDAVVQVTKAG
jgi:hypothetical protein